MRVKNASVPSLPTSRSTRSPLSREFRDAVSRRVLRDAGMNRRRGSFGGGEISGDRRETLDRRNAARPRRTTPDLGARSVGEHAVDRANPRPHRSEVHRVRPGRVRRRHAADRAERSTRRIDRKAKAMSSCGRIDLGAQDARFDANGPRSDVDLRHLAPIAPTTEVDDDPLADRAAGHAAPRTSCDQRQRARSSPLHEEERSSTSRGTATAIGTLRAMPAASA